MRDTRSNMEQTSQYQVGISLKVDATNTLMPDVDESIICKELLIRPPRLHRSSGALQEKLQAIVRDCIERSSQLNSCGFMELMSSKSNTARR